eukprot:TRINITY_DN28078_c0_g1_i1.p1 TRINITY_DN28078_c0_g1~~TRINITY_DN28078_c0_g1_i1.p1  ORF type:complete len:685 (-),score=85.76 TRINITY_DN28078_c0_g1_i1:14-1801(-)
MDGDTEVPQPSGGSDLAQQAHHVKGATDLDRGRPSEGLFSGVECNPPKNHTIAQLLATARLEFSQGNVLLGLHLLVLADTRGVPGRSNPNANREKLTSISQAKHRAAEILGVNLSVLEMLVANNESISVAWQNGIGLVLHSDYLAAARSFHAAATAMNPNIAVTVESCLDFTPWLVYYAAKSGTTGFQLTHFLQAAETFRARSHATPQNGGGLRDTAKAESPRTQVPQKFTHPKEVQIWREAVKLVRTKRNYVEAAYLFAVVKRMSEGPLQALTELDMSYGKQWAEYYSMTVHTPQENFNTEWLFQSTLGESQPYLTAIYREDLASTLVPQAAVIESQIPQSNHPNTIPPVTEPTTEQFVEVVKPPKELFVDPNATSEGDGSESSPFLTVGRALDRVSTGGTISLRSGHYAPLFIADPPPGITIRSTGPHVVIGSSDSQVAIILLHAKNLTVQGLRIEGNIGLQATNCEHLNLENNEFHIGKRAYEYPAGNTPELTRSNKVFVRPVWQRVLEARLPYDFLWLGFAVNAAWMAFTTVLFLWIATYFGTRDDRWTIHQRNQWLWACLVSFVLDIGFLDLVCCAALIALTPLKRQYRT